MGSSEKTLMTFITNRMKSKGEVQNIVFTICSNNYLAQAKVLGKTLLEFNPSFNFIIGLVDRKSELINYDEIPFDVIEVEKIGIPGFDNLITRYNITELNTAVKPFFFSYFFSNFKGVSSIIYLDPDIKVFASFDNLVGELKSYDIILTPHFTKQILDDKLLSEEDILNTGLYNLGFIASK